MEKLKGVLKTIVLMGVVFFAPCCYEEADTEPPAVPRGLTSITGDESVMLTWYQNTEPDLAGYRIYRGPAPEGPYILIGETNLDYFLDYGLANGYTYYYAISAFDIHNNESELSYETVFDTPRPEGYNEKLFDYSEYPDFSGWDFSSYKVVPYNYPHCDFYFGYDNQFGSSFLYIQNPGGLIQDMGYTSSFDEIGYAPTDGWSTSGMAEAINGHTYVIWTWDNHFAKIRITSVNSSYVVFDWAYQIDPGNPELVVKR
uniref:Fibronectin type-III domain-containing protein n=1 Tax=candidate division WOR-3 bacterium TaxID=2052148 RepID=A0A7C4XJA2_UNCW3